MTIDLDKLSDDAAAAVLDVIEEERRINKDDIRGAIKKAVMPHLGVPKVPGGLGVGAFMAVGREFNWGDWPLLPDED